MTKLYSVASSDWRIRIEADDACEAAVEGTSLQYRRFGNKLNLGFCVVVIDESGVLNIFKTSAVLQDIGLHSLSKTMHELGKAVDE